MYSLEIRMLWRDLTVAVQYLKRAYKKDGERLFTRAHRDKTRDNGFKLKERRFILDVRRTFFIMRVVRHWDFRKQGHWHHAFPGQNSWVTK